MELMWEGEQPLLERAAESPVSLGGGQDLVMVRRRM
jgi:hypothetical protein